MRTMAGGAALASAAGGMVALVAMGTLSWTALEREQAELRATIERTERRLGEHEEAMGLAGLAREGAIEIERKIGAQIRAAETRARHPRLRRAALERGESNERAGLTELTTEDIERAAQTHESLHAHDEATAVLKGWVEGDEAVAEIFFTDRHGFNVAASGRTSDFVQSDEAWWQAAWGHGIEVGDAGYDESAGVWSIDMSVRMEHEAQGRPVGVMKNVIDLAWLQETADEMARSSNGGRAYIAQASGMLIAETSSAHAEGRVGNPKVSIAQEEPSTEHAFGGERSGVGEERGDWITGFARTRSESGVDWVVIVQQRRNAGQGAAGQLSRIAAYGARAEGTALACVLGSAAMVLLGACVGARAKGRRMGEDLRHMTEIARANAKGEWADKPEVGRTREIQELNGAMGELSQRLMRVAREHVKLKKAGEPRRTGIRQGA